MQIVWNYGAREGGGPACKAFLGTLSAVRLGILPFAGGDE